MVGVGGAIGSILRFLTSLAAAQWLGADFPYGTLIVNLLGSYIPFARTQAQREARKDPRPSIQERYRDEGDYLAKLRAAAEKLVTDRYLLPEDVDNVIKRGRLQWEFVTAQTTTSSR